MDIQQYFTPEKLQEHYCVISFQEALIKLNKNNVESTSQIILQTPLVSNPDLVKRVAFNVFRTASLRPALIPHLVDVIKNLIDHQSFQNSLSCLKELIAPKNIPNQRWYRSFLINCINKQVITIEEFMNLLTSFPPGESIYLLFCWFAPVIQSRDKTIYENILSCFLNDPNLSPELLFFKNNFNNMQKNDWELQRKYFQNGYYKVSYAYYIKKDKAHKFMKLTCHGEFFDDKKDKKEKLVDDTESYDIASKISSDNEKFDYNQRIEDSLFERCEFVRHRPTLLQFAAFYGSKKCFTLILSKGADPNIKDDEDKVLIQFVIAGGNMAIFNTCLQAKNIFLKDKQTQNKALQTAVEFNRFDMLISLIKKLEIDIKAPDENFPTILHYAAMYNNIQVIFFCLDNGCPINIRDPIGRTPLHYAAQRCQYDALSVLVDAYNVDVNAKDECGKTPLHLAARNNEFDSIPIISSRQDIDLNICDEHGNNAVIIATKYGFNEIVYYLLCQNIDVNQKNESGLAPLHFAVKKGQINMVSLLLTHMYIDVNIQDDKGILFYFFE